MDEEYINYVLQNQFLNDDEVRELLQDIVNDSQLLEYLISTRELPKQNIISNNKSKSIQVPKQQPVIVKDLDIDENLKKHIVSKYDLVESKPIRNITLPLYITEKNKKQIRYHNDLVVTTKGEKYVDMMRKN